MGISVHAREAILRAMLVQYWVEVSMQGKGRCSVIPTVRPARTGVAPSTALALRKVMLPALHLPRAVFATSIAPGVVCPCF